ncbi:MAG: substrate-binding domain-containing protein [Candidatus Sumerlaeota bacterium]|nr:substrate-binding domain-containing protein [Candidatus Sumerlaeota bacterium]
MNKVMKCTLNWMFVVAIGMALAAMGGCGKSEEKGVAAGQKKFLIVFSQCNNAEPYRAAQNELMRQLVAKIPDVRLTIMDAQQDNAKQISEIETAIREKPAVLIVAPNERAPLTPVMKKAMDAGIPTLCLERDIMEPNYTSYIKCDNRAIGKLAGEFIVKKLTEKNGAPKGVIVEISGLKGVEGEINRQAGAHEILDKYPDIKVAANPVADWLQGKGMDRMIEALAALPKIDCVYGHNDPMAVGAYLAAKAKGREKEMFFVGVDGLGGEAGGIKKVMDGVLAATFVYPLCVDKAIEIANKIIHEPRFKPEKEYLMQSQAVTPENAAQLYKP